MAESTGYQRPRFDDRDVEFYARLAEERDNREPVRDLVVPHIEGRAFTVDKGQMLRVACIEGPLVADFNAFNRGDPKEMFWSGRTRRGRPYQKDRLARDVRIILRAAGVPDAVQLRELRRTASKERAKAGATEAELASSTGHSIEHGSKILDTYNPRSFEQAKSAQDKRRKKALKNIK